MDDADMDGDGLEDAIDTDDDNDGMPDWYEEMYGDQTPMDKDDISGWQNAYVHNARYAILIGGGSIGSNNYSAFSNDLKAMYDKLYFDYSYEHRNIFSFLWNVPEGKSYWSEGDANSTNIGRSFEIIRDRINSNDMFLFTGIAHGAGYSDNDDAFLNIYEGNDLHLGHDDIDNLFFSIKREIDDKINKAARMVFIFQSCQASCGIHHLSYNNSIVVCPEDYRIDSWIDLKGNSFTDVDSHFSHWAFIFGGTFVDWFDIEFEIPPVITYFPGFIPSLGTINNSNNLLFAFNRGCIAAQNNYDNNPLSSTNGISHPMLEDNNSINIYGTRGVLSPTSPFDEGWLAQQTFL